MKNCHGGLVTRRNNEPVSRNKLLHRKHVVIVVLLQDLPHKFTRCTQLTSVRSLLFSLFDLKPNQSLAQITQINELLEKKLETSIKFQSLLVGLSWWRFFDRHSYLRLGRNSIKVQEWANWDLGFAFWSLYLSVSVILGSQFLPRIRGLRMCRWRLGPSGLALQFF